MPYQASTDRDLARAGAGQRNNGARFLLLGAVMLAVGLLLMPLSEGNLVDFVGMVLATLSSIPIFAGLALLASSIVARRASRRKPFA